MRKHCQVTILTKNSITSITKPWKQTPRIINSIVNFTNSNFDIGVSLRYCFDSYFGCDNCHNMNFRDSPLSNRILCVAREKSQIDVNYLFRTVISYVDNVFQNKNISYFCANNNAHLFHNSQNTHHSLSSCHNLQVSRKRYCLLL